MIAPARIAAYDISRAVSRGRTDLPAAIARARASLDDDRDRALAADIATGVQRWRAALDHLIVHVSKRSIERIDPEVVEILRLSAYQLLHLTRVPAAAVVDDAVELAKRAGKRSAGGFVNAVLRGISRSRQSLPLPPRPPLGHDAADRQAALAYLSITLSHPRWLVERWLDRFGFDATEQWLRFNNTPAPLTLRANRFRSTPAKLAGRLARDGIVVRPGRFAPDALIVEEGHPLRTSVRLKEPVNASIDRRTRGVRREDVLNLSASSARSAVSSSHALEPDTTDESDASSDTAGWFVVQDEASQLVALLAATPPGRRVLDACASPGGKTTALASAMNGAGMLVACDVRDRRMALLRRTVAASGAPNVRLVQADLLRPLPFSQPFDCVLVDAPCSGLGVLRRDPDVRWRRQEDDLEPLAAAQLTMLQHAAALVAAGGRLVYATCSSEPEENEAIVQAFLSTTPGFAAVDLRDVAARETTVPADVIDARGHLRTVPHLHGLEAFFGAVLVRQR